MKKNNIMSLLVIALLLVLASTDFEPDEEPAPKPVTVKVICIDTNDVTTYEKRVDLQVACSSKASQCKSEAESMCPTDLSAVYAWVE